MVHFLGRPIREASFQNDSNDTAYFSRHNFSLSSLRLPHLRGDLHLNCPALTEMLAASPVEFLNIPAGKFPVHFRALELLKNSNLFTKIKDLDLSLEIIHTYGAIADEMKLVKFYNEHKNDYLEEAMTGNVKEVLSRDNITAEQLWSAITASKEGKQFLRELNRLQMLHNSSGVKATIAGTISSIDKYIQ